MRSSRRVVITGMGVVCPLGIGVRHVWSRLCAGESAISSIQGLDVSDMPCRIGAQVPSGSRSEHKFNAEEWVSPKELRQMDLFIVYALAAADMAIEDSGWKPSNEQETCRTGVLIGSGIGGLQRISDNVLKLRDQGPRRISPFFIASALINLAAGHVSIRHGFRGPNHSVVTACATGTHAIGDAARLIMFGDADVMVAGGTEYPITRVGIAGFSSARALSTSYNETPEKASRPWDRGRDGFVMGGGAGVMVLEDYEHARKRGATLYAEVCGYGLSGDAWHVTAPAEDGSGGYRSMEAALRNASLRPEQIGYINAHGTSTPIGDDIELKAVENLFGDHCPRLAMSSTKSSIGHLLGAAGAVEAIFSAMVLRDSVLPPTLNLESPSRQTLIDRVALQSQERKIDYVLSNSFGFGGTNTSIVLGKI